MPKVNDDTITADKHQRKSKRCVPDHAPRERVAWTRYAALRLAAVRYADDDSPDPQGEAMDAVKCADTIWTESARRAAIDRPEDEANGG